MDTQALFGCSSDSCRIGRGRRDESPASIKAVRCWRIGRDPLGYARDDKVDWRSAIPAISRPSEKVSARSSSRSRITSSFCRRSNKNDAALRSLDFSSERPPLKLSNGAHLTWSDANRDSQGTSCAFRMSCVSSSTWKNSSSANSSASSSMIVTPLTRLPAGTRTPSINRACAGVT